MNQKEIARNEWVKHWQGNWSLLSCSYFGEQYTKSVSSLLGTSVNRAVLVLRDGFSACYFPKSDLDVFGKALASSVMEDPKIAASWCRDLKKQTDRFLSTVQKYRNQELNQEQYEEFWDALYSYVSPHIAVKKVVDYLPPEVLEDLLPKLQDARLYSEPVYGESEDFMEDWAEIVGEKENYPAKLVLSSTKEEIKKYFETGKLPGQEVLLERFDASALLYEKGKYVLAQGKDAVEIETAIMSAGARKDEVSGKTAYPGKANGKARIVFEPSKAKFQDGEVLVTGMTRPEFIPLMKRASAVVTDAGGVLCHAAIVCRELKIPGVVGTERATRLFKTGDVLEVDATKGKVRKIS